MHGTEFGGTSAWSSRSKHGLPSPLINATASAGYIRQLRRISQGEHTGAVGSFSASFSSFVFAPFVLVLPASSSLFFSSLARRLAMLRSSSAITTCQSLIPRLRRYGDLWADVNVLESLG
jgi:hypothetical protein